MRDRTIVTLGLALFVSASWVGAQGVGEKVDLLSLQMGTLPIVAPASYSGWSVEAMLDDSPQSGWACPDGRVANNVFVFEMVAPAAIERFEFDTAGIDEDGAGAKDVTVEVSARSKDAGFETVLTASLADKADRQRFAASRAVSGRFVRLTIRNNHGNGSYTELLGFRGYGTKPPASQPLADISGTYNTDYSKFHVRQQGTALVGCYEYSQGLLDGAIEGRLMKINWREADGHGPAVMVFSTDGVHFRGYYWSAGSEKREPAGRWDGTRVAAAVGGCPHWAGSLGGEVKKKLARAGRVAVYGILFDLDSAVIRPESKPVLDEVLGVLKSEAAWALTIEGHTDSSGSDAHNQTLSLQRAESVKAYMVANGIAAARLRASGLGESRPVADNATELGRAQNRRVELVKQ
jgi:OmpA-OmpF porin, OOP family